MNDESPALCESAGIFLLPADDGLNCDMNWNIQLDPLGIAQVRQAAVLPEFQGQNIDRQSVNGPMRSLCQGKLPFPLDIDRPQSGLLVLFEAGLSNDLFIF